MIISFNCNLPDRASRSLPRAEARFARSAGYDSTTAAEDDIAVRRTAQSPPGGGPLHSLRRLRLDHSVAEDDIAIRRIAQFAATSGALA